MSDIHDKYPVLPEWKQTAKAALDAANTRTRTRKPAAPTRAELIEQLRNEVRELTRNAPGIRGRLLVLCDQIEAARK